MSMGQDLRAFSARKIHFEGMKSKFSARCARRGSFWIPKKRAATKFRQAAITSIQNLYQILEFYTDGEHCRSFTLSISQPDTCFE